VFEDSVLRLEKDHNTRPRPEKDWFSWTGLIA